ncbi:MAG: hypothetical protein DCC49_01940 [Acidobacteria bacterium]|nr:MAG: hypothetical protein DCC49_01940 [Acidobacteriota bacterium]
MFFLISTLITVIFATIHVFLDRKADRRTKRRVVELFLIWWIAGSGFWSVFGGVGHIGPNAAEIAGEIGPAYIPSMFQWEVGWGDIAIGVILLLCIWNRGSFMNAAVIAWTISYWGDAIGHIMQVTRHNNMAPDNVWSIPTDFGGPLAAIILLLIFRRLSRTSEEPS